MGASQERQKRSKAGKLNIGRFTPLPHHIVSSAEFRGLGYSARSLLFDMALQYNGNNNGKLVACDKFLKPLGWNSNGTITRALKQLVASGLIIQTRQGMMPPYSKAAWFALGWFSLDVTEGLDIEAKGYRRCSVTPYQPSPIKIKVAAPILAQNLRKQHPICANS